MDAIRHHRFCLGMFKDTFCGCVYPFFWKQHSKYTDKQKQTETKIFQTTVLTKCVSGGAFLMSFVSSLFFANEEVGACRSFRVQCRGLKFHVFLWHLRVCSWNQEGIQAFQEEFLVFSTAL